MYDIVWLYDIFILEMWHIFSIIFSIIFLSYIYFNAKKSKLLYHYLLLHSILLIWLIAKVFKTIAPTAEIKWVFIVAQYFAVCFLGSVFLMFAYLYSRGKSLSLPLKIIINIPPVFFFLVIVTNKRHHLFYETYNFLGDTFGPLFYIYMVFTYIYLAAGIYLCSSCFRKQFGKKEIQAKFFVAGIMLPLVVNILYVSGITEPRFDITPVMTNVSLFFFAYAVYKYQFLDIVPAGIFLSLNRLKDGVLVIGDGGNIIYKNYAIEEIFHKNLSTVNNFDKFIYKLNGEKNFLKNLISGLNKTTSEKRKELFFPEQARHFVVYTRLITDKKNELYLIVVSDITVYQELIYRLEEKNKLLADANERMISYKKDLKKLALIEERNRIAGEIHDILGHSLTLILNILESSNIMLDIDHLQAKKKIKQALLETELSIEEINKLYRRNSKETNRRQRTVKQLKLSLHKLADRFRTTGLRVEVNFFGTEHRIKAQIFTALIRISQEALTNSLKHGHAEKVNIILRVSREKVDIYILDNGTGCKVLKRGNGLRGMQERIENIFGSFSCGSPEGKGFNIHARIPL